MYLVLTMVLVALGRLILHIFKKEMKPLIIILSSSGIALVLAFIIGTILGSSSGVSNSHYGIAYMFYCMAGIIFAAVILYAIEILRKRNKNIHKPLK